MLTYKKLGLSAGRRCNLDAHVCYVDQKVITTDTQALLYCQTAIIIAAVPVAASIVSTSTIVRFSMALAYEPSDSLG